MAAGERRIVGPLQGTQESHWRNWRQCSLELGPGEASPGEGYLSHLTATCNCICAVSQASSYWRN